MIPENEKWACEYLEKFVEYLGIPILQGASGCLLVEIR